MLKVGLTGGIATGKSHVLGEFRRLGVYTIDADEIARRVVLPQTPAYEKIVETFGEEILSPDRGIDRKRLGQIVFTDARKREELNRIVHPYVFEEEERLIAHFQNLENPRSPIVMVDAALMIETGSYRRYDSVVVVYCHPAIQLQRLMNRDHLSEVDALKRIESQMPVLEKIKYATYVVENSGKLEDVRDQVKQIFMELVHMYEEKKS